MADMELFWKTEDQAARLAELTSLTGELKELPLRRDVRSLGMLLGAVIREQAGEQALLAQAGKIIGRMSVADAYQIVKAFSTYFELTNLAETNHRKRRRRA